MSSQDFPDLTPARTFDEPYPQSFSAQDPINHYEVATGLEILIINAKANQNMVSLKQFDQVLNDLKRIALQTHLPKNLKLAIEQLLSQYKMAGATEGNKVKVDIDKLQAILNVLLRA